jgi:uncharacterized protein YggE
MTARLRPTTAVAVLVAALLAPPASAQQPVAEPLPGLAVTGRAVTLVTNDTATFRFSVSSRRTTAAAALRSAGATLERVVAALRAQGVGAQDVQTEGLGVRRQSRRDARTRGRRTTFVATTTVGAAVRPVERAGAVVDAAVAAGATEVDGPELTASDPEEAYRQALTAAFLDARSKAERLAAQAGVLLGRPIRLVEGDGAGPGSDQLLSAGGGGDVVVRGGRTRIEATLAVTFAIG